MRIVIDECVPRIAKRGLPSRSIVSVQEMGWAGVKNGKLLKLVADEFDVFITSDQNLRFQQNLAAIDLAVIVLPSNQVPVVKLLLPAIDEAL
ncbi:MAG TPA: hypothetical protein PLK77_17405, partial [Pyrinomonadaceae bacterium]|nr:hypothetical protein [Pyrinomonadaceae bacterium]